MNKYHILKEVADDCGYEVDRLLVYGITGELEICLLAHEPRILKEIGLEVKPELIGKIGPYPIPGENILKILNADFFSSADRPSKGEICKRLIVTHEEKLRFKPPSDQVNSNDIGEKERSTWLKIIYLLMRKLANHQSSLVKKSDVKMSELEKVLKKAAKDHGLTDKGLSDSNLSNIYNEAVRVLMPDPPPLLKK